ncbi:hypothetical protein LCGC14_0410130 [marine sediment metagenome]|uniref:Uncharacterized protein n=1 Tax=marine sediment metagenome TaxID=412755 RepID=A0A0F9SZT9_9ZZZZ
MARTKRTQAEEPTTIEALQAIMGALHEMDARLDKLETPETVTAHSAAKPQGQPEETVTQIKTDDPELVALSSQIARQSKVKLLNRCATHSVAAIRTYMLAGGKQARMFMRGDRTEAKEREAFAMLDGSDGRPKSVSYQYASALLQRAEQGKGPLTTTKSRGMPKGSKNK